MLTALGLEYRSWAACLLVPVTVVGFALVHARAALRAAGSAGSDLIFCLGGGFESMLYSEANAFPGSRFVVIPALAGAMNVAGVVSCWRGGHTNGGGGAKRTNGIPSQ